jgi:hypothetical protein
MHSSSGGDPRPEGPESFASEADEGPRTQPEGALVPPPWKPPTALGADDAPAPLDPRRFREAWRQQRWRGSWLAATVNQLLDSADSLADRIRAQLRLR